MIDDVQDYFNENVSFYYLQDVPINIIFRHKKRFYYKISPKSAVMCGERKFYNGVSNEPAWLDIVSENIYDAVAVLNDSMRNVE